MSTPLGLVLAFVSALAVNWAYTREHDAAAAMPAFSLRRPRRFLALLLGDPGWLLGFGVETGGWLVYVAALRLAPITLVQAVGASGIAVLALASVGGHVGELGGRDRAAVVTAVGGLVLLALSLVGTDQPDREPAGLPVALWLGCLLLVALSLAGAGLGLGRGPSSLGLAAGLLFAGGDISAKLVAFGGSWFFAVVGLIICYGLGSSFLQRAFQHGDALTTAGIATLASNAVPISAGFAVFDERLPGGARGALQLVALCALVVSAALLARSRRPAGVPRLDEV